MCVTLSSSSIRFLLAFPLLWPAVHSPYTRGGAHTPDLTSCDGHSGVELEGRICRKQRLTFVPGAMPITVNQRNGNIEVQGWEQETGLVVAEVNVWSSSEAIGREIASEVRVQVKDGHIEVEGPDLNRGLGSDGCVRSPVRCPRYWVNYKIFIPEESNLRLATYTGSISVRAIRGALNLTSTRGQISLSDLAGDVQARTQSGNLLINLTGEAWQGRGLDAETADGRITVGLPEHYSARLDAETLRGHFQSEFSTAPSRRSRGGYLSQELGSGGALVRVKSRNGSILIRRVPYTPRAVRGENDSSGRGDTGRSHVR